MDVESFAQNVIDEMVKRRLSLSLSLACFFSSSCVAGGGGSRRVSEFSMAISARMSRRDSEDDHASFVCVLLHAISQSTAPYNKIQHGKNGREMTPSFYCPARFYWVES
jgi:hypothetical protein